MLPFWTFTKQDSSSPLQNDLEWSAGYNEFTLRERMIFRLLYCLKAI
jgi:hypothetical protein